MTMRMRMIAKMGTTKTSIADLTSSREYNRPGLVLQIHEAGLSLGLFVGRAFVCA